MLCENIQALLSDLMGVGRGGFREGFSEEVTFEQNTERKIEIKK